MSPGTTASTSFRPVGKPACETGACLGRERAFSLSPSSSRPERGPVFRITKPYCLPYLRLSRRWRCLSRRMALRCAMRRLSLGGTKQRFFRTVLRIRARFTFFRKRFNRLSIDSPSFRTTRVTLHSPPWTAVDSLPQQNRPGWPAPARRMTATTGSDTTRFELGGEPG